MLATSIYSTSLQHPFPPPPTRGRGGFPGHPPSHFGHFGPPEVTFGGPHSARGGHAFRGGFRGGFRGAYPPAPEFMFGNGFPDFNTGDFFGMRHPHSICRDGRSRGGFHTMRPEPCFLGHPSFLIEGRGFEDRERAEDSSSPEFVSHEFSCEFGPTAPGSAHYPGRVDGRNDCHCCAEQEHGLVDSREFPRGCEMRGAHGPHFHPHFHPYGGRGGHLRGGACRGRGLHGCGRGHAFRHNHSWCQRKLYESDPEVKGEGSAEGKAGTSRDAEKSKDRKDDDVESIENVSVTSTVPEEVQNNEKTTTGKGKAKETVIDE
ncbi:hypothetical protein ACEPAG_3448 [Sanghuangporus baumii]